MKKYNKSDRSETRISKHSQLFCLSTRRKALQALVVLVIVCAFTSGVFAVGSPLRADEKPRKTKQSADQTEDQVLLSVSEQLSTEQEVAALKKEELELVQEVMRNFPGRDDSYMLAGNFYRRHGNSEEAIKLWERSLTINPKLHDVYRSLGQIAQEKGESDKAIMYWRKFLEVNPTLPSVHANLAQALIDSGKYEQAIKELEEEIKISSLSGRVTFMLAQSYLQLKEYDKARKYYEAAIELDPNHTHAYYGLSTLYIRLKQSDKAQKYLEIYRKLKSKELDAHMGRKGDVFADLISLRKGVARTHLDAEKIYRSKGNAKRVEELLIRALQLEPANIICLERLASLYQMTNRIPDALSQFEKIRKMQPKNALCYLNIGILSIQLKRFDNAEKAFQKAIELAPNKSFGYRHLARLYLRMNKRLVEARKLAEKATSLEATAENYFVLSWACDMNGDTTSALAAIEQAIRLDPGKLIYRQAYENIKGRN
jgi:tetratricopeptide (TPR) repeat protein